MPSGLRTVYKKPPSHPSGGDGREITIADHLADSGDSDGVYRGADGGGTWGELGVAEDHEKGDGFAGRSALMSSIWNVNLDF